MQSHPHTQKRAIHLRGLSKSFGEGPTRVDAVRGVDLDAFTGELLILAGPSGCGKTTLLSLIAGMLDCCGGSVRVLGHYLEKKNADEKSLFRSQNVGFVFQQFNLVPTLSAAENVAIPLLLQKRPYRQALLHAEEMLVQVGLNHRLRAFPSSLSGGEQQRVAIARALVTQPRLLICDEPTAALDGETGAKVMQMIRAVARTHDRCVLVVTHDSRIFEYGDRIARMADGEIISVQPERIPVLLTPADDIVETAHIPLVGKAI